MSNANRNEFKSWCKASNEGDPTLCPELKEKITQLSKGSSGNIQQRINQIS